ncbi:hypothetical protein [Bacillus norwichensis]|uniref:Uncharacterized protein n=1 Tax=Bacillus norwichensis TaxID=2762217 RepID=A0ABR8VJQ0_9BACI|nr:hypothetical protein [Bacillus norwichensis]MBD8004626.1 hypothetical protein [Bacillus norwichensis]
MKNILLIAVCSLYLWPIGNDGQMVVRTLPLKEENIDFIVTDRMDAVQNIPREMLEEQLPQFIPNADGNASINNYKLPQAEEAFNYLTEVKVRQ